MCYTITKLFFALHPTHIECVSNAANRPHLLALLFVLLQLDVDLPLVFSVLLQFVGLLSCETAVFCVPGIIASWILFAKVQNRNEMKIFSKGLALTLITLAYVIIRHVLNWNQIPKELLRNAENPYVLLTGRRRLLSYSYSLTIHLFKAMSMGFIDWVGFSHEYGYDCIKEVKTLSDGRLYLPVLVILILVYILFMSVKFSYTFEYMTFVTWLFTLMPVSGFMNVGTFVADRICLPLTVASSVLWGHVLVNYVLKQTSLHDSGVIRTNLGSFTLLTLYFLYLSTKLYYRSMDWMDSQSLLQSGLWACPNSAKINLEQSKLHSGLVPHLLDYEKALQYIDTAREIDETYCDVYLQYAHVYSKQLERDLFERNVVHAVTCPFTMEKGAELYLTYWTLVLQENGSRERTRFEQFQNWIDEYIGKEERLKKGR